VQLKFRSLIRKSKQVRFNRKSKVRNIIPTASMADISFLLLVFFMVSTVFVRYRGVPVELPEAEKIEKLESRRNVLQIWVDSGGKINIEDRSVPLDVLGTFVHQRLTANPRLIISLRGDKDSQFGIISDVMQELRKVEALRVNFSTKRETE
jgi:biopolymer transport protein ExbD